ncbi:MAG: twin-arginine translocase TatA/TatE family subunit [Alphaproteobacteria bacterium]|nr:twin-arginine translocase TatA/TatE family subunit [Alphaproteobacteria bacterium]
MAPGFFQIAIVLLLVFLIFGAARVPLIAENLAKGIKSFKKGLRDEDDSAPKALEKNRDDQKNG